MCQSKEQGGRRCATHLRAPYQLAIDSALRYKANDKTKAVEALNDLYAIAVEYAGTIEGAEKISRDIKQDIENVEFNITLRKALKKAKENSIAEDQAEAIINKARGTTVKEPTKNHLNSNGTPPEPISWGAGEPIWPSRETMADAVKYFHGTPEEKQFVMKAYRSIFRIEWRNLFLSTDHKSFEPPKDNREGWEWRRQATEAANRQIMGARVIKVPEAIVGMTVYNGYGIKTIKSIVVTPATNWMDNTKSRVSEAFYLVYNDLLPNHRMADDVEFVLLPNCKVVSNH